MTEPLTRPAAAAAVDEIGWRLLLGAFCAYVPTVSFVDAVAVAGAAVEACGADADEHLALDLRSGRVDLTLQSRSAGQVTERDAELAAAVTAALTGRGYRVLARSDERHYGHGIQLLELAIDALDIPAIRPFWKAVLGYVDEPGRDGPTAALVDPLRRGPALWFQQMDEPRPQRNRIHFDLDLPHDEADARIAAALAAGGRLVSDASARAFWVLADLEGNEICICTWQDRD